LSTKLNRPPVTSDWVDRPRLIDRLNHSSQEGPLTLVCASAGFGKTTLVSSWIDSLASSQRPSTRAAWVSLDERDSDLVVFLRYCVAAIRTVFPESCTESVALLQTSQPVSQMPLVVALTNDIDRLPARCVLVLDDYYTIGDEAVHDFLSALVRHWPPKLHLVLITRSSPPLPLSQLRARGQVGEIRTNDLRFRPDESAEFLSKVLRAPISASSMAMLEERLEGWIAGLRLVTLSLDAGANVEHDLADLSGTHLEIADYLVDEVISNQPADILKFLLATSILDRFCAPLGESILGSADGRDGSACDVRACMQWLERHNLFVVPLDDHRQWYRYHHLFQELLQRRLLNDVGPEKVAELHRRAIAWFEGQGLIDEAIHHALAINDIAKAAELMVAGTCDTLNREDSPTFQRWLRLLPEDFVQRQPWLLTIKAVAFALSWQLAGFNKVLDQIDALLAEGEDPAPGPGGQAMRWVSAENLSVARGVVAALRALQAFAAGRVDRALAVAEEALALLPHSWSYLRGVAVQYWGLAMQASGYGADAQRRLIEEHSALVEKTSAYGQPLLFAVCFNAIESGDLEQARQYGEVMLDQATAGQLPQAVGMAQYFLGVVGYCRNELDVAGQYFGELVAKRLSVHTQAARNGMIGLTRVHVARAESSSAWSVIELLSQFDMDRLGLQGDDARSLRAQLQYRQGDPESAFRWADGYAAPVIGRSLLWLQNPHLAKAQILLDRGTGADVQSALDILEALDEIARRNFSVRTQVEVLALRALALEKQDKAADAFAALREAVELARPGGFIRVFVDLGPPMQSMLLALAGQALAGQGFTAEIVRRILAAFPEPEPESATGDAGFTGRAANAKLVEPLVEPLTDREQEVLALLRERLSNKEIAHMLGLSPATVKRYTVNLYGKLGVGKRSNAVFKAEALGILPQR
jgi:LuxR family maltose regulon positive regulatory protein